MNVERVRKTDFYVIGKEGSTLDGENFVKTLWDDVNSHFNEIDKLAKRNSDGTLFQFWGLMSDMNMNFKPWENNFSKGKYLAGIEVEGDSVAPSGWVKWHSPAYEYIRVLVEDDEAFMKGLEYLRRNGLELAGAVYDSGDPKTGRNYMWFPIVK